MANSLASLFTKPQRNALSKDSPTPLYHQLYSLLKGFILDGTLPLGEQMPTEEQLAGTFSVSRITAKRAMDELANDKLVERRRGKGSHVIYKYILPVHAPLIGMLEEIESMARNSRAIILECSMMQPPLDIRTDLELEPDETALHLIRVRERKGLKFGYYVSWTAGVEMPARKKVFENTPRLTYFRENGLDITHVTQTLSAVAATAEVADALEIDPGSPLLSLTRRSYNTVRKREHMRDYLQILYRPDRFQYQMDLKI